MKTLKVGKILQMNKLKLQLENFQSISKGELEFQTGLNFIIGQSNSGKSATFRALKACLCNPIGSQRYIKNGTSQSTVILEYNDNEIIWNRTSKSSSYTINGEDYEKTGKSDAFKILTEDLGFTKDDNDNVMNIEEELQLPFPFGYSKSDLFKLFENIFCVSDSAVILKSAKEHEDKVKTEISFLKEELSKNQTKINELELFKKEVNLSEILNYIAKYKRKNNKLVSLKEGLDIIRKANLLSDIDLDFSNCDFKDRLEDLENLIKIKNISVNVKRLHALSKILPELSCNATVNKINDYKDKCALKDEINKIQKLNEITLIKEEFTDKSLKYKELLKYKQSLENIKNAVISKKKKLQEIQSKLNIKEEKLKEYKVCPLCHKPLD